MTHDKNAKARKFQVQDRVYARNFSDGEVWIPGVIAKCIGPLSFIVKLEDGRTIRRHIDHLQPHFVSLSSSLSDPSPEWIDMRLHVMMIPKQQKIILLHLLQLKYLFYVVQLVFPFHLFVSTQVQVKDIETF